MKPIKFDDRWRAATPAMKCMVLELGSRVLAHETRKRARRADDLTTMTELIELLVCNLLAVELATGRADDVLGLRVSRELETRRANDVPHVKSWCKLLDLFKDAGFIYQSKGGGYREGTTGRLVATSSATDDLRSALQGASWHDLHVGRYLRAPVRVHVDGKPVHFAAAAYSRQLQEMRIINDWMLEIRGEHLSVDGNYGGWIEEVSERLPRVMTTQMVELSRVFSGDAEHGGRLYGGFWINKPKEWRFKHIQLDGRPVVELDYSTFNLRLAYHHAGVSWPFADNAADAYIAGPFGQRDGWKRMTNAMFMATDEMGQFPGNTEGRAQLRRMFPKGTSPVDVRQRIELHHEDISELFGTGIASRFQNIESNMLVMTLLECQRQGIPCLPIHDSILVATGHERMAQAIMELSASQIAGLHLPVSITHASKA